MTTPAIPAFLHHVRSSRQHLRQSKAAMPSGVHVSPEAASVLWLLAANGPTRMNALATALECPAQNMTDVSDRLVARGLVTRASVKGDQRGVRLILTDAGQALAARLMEMARVI